jgi:uncharacterized protein YqfA (UPF0365 family)
MNGFVFGFLTGAAAATAAVIALTVARGWRHAYFAGAPVGWPMILGMRLRGSPPTLIVDAYVALRKRDRTASVADVEATYLARRGGETDARELADLVDQALRARAG